LSAEAYGGIIKIAEDNRVTVFHVLLGTISIVLSKYFRKDKVSIGIPVLNRTNAASKRTMGPFINVIPLRFNISDDMSVSDLFSEVKKETFSCYKHQRFQYADILRSLNEHSGTRLYEVRLSYENFEFSARFSKL